MDELKCQVDNVWKEIIEMDNHLDGVSPSNFKHSSSPSPDAFAEDFARHHNLGSPRKRLISKKSNEQEGSPTRYENTDLLRQKLKMRDAKLETVIQISQCFFEEFQKAKHETDMLKRRSHSLYRRQEENTDDKTQLECLAQRQMQQLVMM